MTAPQEMTKLLPCPFCGGSVKLERATDTYEQEHGRREWWGIVCRNTINLGGTCAVEARPSASKDAAIKRWNRRASLSADRVSGWVKCSERLPESGDVLVAWEKGSVECMDSSSVESYTHRLLADGQIVTHWMPLPAAPQPTEDSNAR